MFHAWIDMNEPSVFDGPEGSLPRDSIHRYDYSSNVVLNKDIKNIYGLKMMEATFDGIL
jgi:alpha-glucosidase (family GH31 glycosyl hydrolase)